METQHLQWLKDVGDRIAQKRNERHWTQQDLSTKSGLAIATVRQIEQGTKPSNIVTLRLLAETLETPTDYLIWGHDAPLNSAEFVLDV